MLKVLRVAGVPRLLVSSLVGRVPLGATPLALVLFGQTMLSVAGVGALVAAFTVGVACGQPLLSRWADRWRQPPVMWCSLAVSTLGYAGLLTRPAPAAMLGLALLAGLGAPPLEPCLRVLWRDVAGGGLLHAAYAVDIAAQELIFIAGPLVTVAGVQLAGPSGGVAAAGVLQLAGTVVFASAPASRRWRGDAHAPRHWAGPLRASAVRLLAVATLFVGAGLGATVIAVGASLPEWSGWLLSMQAVGALAGGLVAARFPARDLWRRLPRLVAVFSLSYLPLLLVAGDPKLMLAAIFVSGVLLPAVLTYIFAAASQASPPGTETESFAWVATAFGVGSAIGSAVNGAWLSAGYVLAPATIAAAALLLSLHRRFVAQM